MFTRICLIIFIIPGCNGFVNPLTRITPSFNLKRLSGQSTTSNRPFQKPIRLAGSNHEDWKVGDVYRDLDVLEQAINFANAEQNLKHTERIEMMDYCARQRRPLIPDFRKFILAPLSISLLLRIVNENTTIKFVTRMITACMDFHFWMVVVFAPIILLVAKLISKPEPEPMPEELKGLAPEYLPFVTTDWEDPETSSQDHVLFLLEYWGSAVLGVSIIGVLNLLKLIPTRNVVRFWMSLAQLLTRVGVLASLHQYQRQIFKLLRHQQPRPIGFFPSILQSLVRCMVAAAPWGITFDLLKSLTHLKNDSLVALYTTITALLFGTWMRMQQKDLGGFQKLEQKSFGAKLLQIAATTAFWKKPLANIHQKLQTISFQRYLSNWPKVLLAFSATSIVGLLPILGPIIHMKTITSQFRVVYTHDLSLSIDAKAFKESLENGPEMKQRMKWRYRIEWRDEKRLRPLIKEWNSGWGYWWLIKGTVTEKLNKEQIEQRKKAELEGQTVLEKVKEDGMPKHNRDQWKREAMERLGKKHQEDYDKKDYEDHLGVAVYRIFGIGLGYNFNHMRTLDKNEKPSARRLQARAAKSAIRRVQELYDSQAAKKELDGIADPAERNRKARELREQTDVEIKYLAKRLTELVPQGFSPEFENRGKIQRFKQAGFKRTSANEYVTDNPFANESAQEMLFRSYHGEKQEISRETDSESKDEPTPDSGDPDDFVEAYLKDLENSRNDDGDDNIVFA